MNGLLRIDAYQIHCIIGSHPEEREDKQLLEVDIEMQLDLSECVQTDSIADTIDYNEIVLVCEELAEERRYHLIETFAYEAIHALMRRFSPPWIKVRVRKKAALRLARAAMIELELRK